MVGYIRNYPGSTGVYVKNYRVLHNTESNFSNFVDCIKLQGNAADERNNVIKLICKIISFFYQCSKLCDRAFSARENQPFLWCKYCMKRKLAGFEVCTECFQDIR